MSKSLRSRMGSVMRRSSTILSISRPSTPGRTDSDDGSVASVKVDTLAPPAADPTGSSMPSPIAESPAREAEAIATDPVGPSPLAETIVAESPRSIAPNLPSDVTAEPSPATTMPEIIETAPTPITPLNAPGPGAFTDEPELPQSQPTDPREVAVASKEQQGLVGVSSSYLDTLVPEVASTPRAAFQTSIEDLSTERPIFGSTQGTPQPRLSQIPDASRQLTPRGSSRSSLYATGRSQEISVPMYPQSSPKASKVSLVPSTQGQTGAFTPRIGQGNERASFYQSNASSVRSTGMPVSDPFADSQIVPGFPSIIKNDTYAPAQPSFMDQHEDTQYGHVVVPLPAPQEVMASGSLLNTGYSLGGGKVSTTRMSHETDERRPLLSRPTSPNHDRQISYLQPSGSGYIAMSSRAPHNPTHNAVSTPLLHNFGWVEYVLPDASFYYVHPTLRVTTDIDLRSTKKLELVTSYLDHKDAGAPAGLEIWLQNSSTSKHDFVPYRIWIDHRKRGVSFDSPLARDGDVGGSKHPGDDRLDMEYRYWSFMEAHPAHMSLPANARMDAMDALSWAYADRLLPTNRRAPLPFTQAECQDLMNVLRTFGDTSANAGNHNVVHTRVVSRILLRVAHWRQVHFRPEKALPLDATHRGRRMSSRLPFPRTIVDFFVSFLCLGIPYFFIERSNVFRADEESGLRGVVPKLVIWASTCLVAAIVLSTSVTFLSLPGLDNITRVAGFVATFFSTASITSSVIALLRFKSDVDRVMSSVGGEGLMMQPRRCFVMSLPVVFLAYSIAAFITGLSLYSFRGTVVTNPQLVTHPFDDYIKWTVVGGIGGLVTMLAASALFSRR